MPIGIILKDLRDESFIFTELLSQTYKNDSISIEILAKLQTFQIC